MASKLTVIWTLLLLCYSYPAWAVEQDIDIDVDFKQLGAAYALLVSFTAAPEIAASRYTIDSGNELDDDATLKSTKLPFYREFNSEQHDWRWYMQATFSYSSYEQKLNFDLDAPFGGTARFDWTGYGGLFEAGVILPLGSNFSWTAGLGGGISRLESEADFDNGALEELFAPKLDGRVYNWKTDTTNLRGNLGLLYDARHKSFGIKGSAHYTYSKISTFNESSQFDGFSDFASVLAFKLDVRHPLQVELFQYPTYIVGHLGQTNFLGDNKNELGFNAFSEVGLSLGVQKFTLGALGVIGSNVKGWNIVFNYDY